MRARGNNLPRFREAQLAFAAYIRDPANEPAPVGIEARRLKIYVELFYNNVERFLATTFPVAKTMLADETWAALVRDFLVRYRATSPYFHEIPQEFLEYLGTRDQSQPPPIPQFLLELCHYEWVELALAVSEDEWPTVDIDPDGDLLDGRPVLSPLAWSLCYRHPVHRLGPAHRPLAPPTEPTHLIVYRNRDDDVRFLESNAVTARLVALLDAREGPTGRDVLHTIAGELGREDVGRVVASGRQTLERLRSCDIIAGTSTAEPMCA